MTGDRAISLADVQRRRLLDKLRRELGETVLAALDDRRVVEVLLNPDGRLWVDRLGEGLSDTGATMPAAQARSLIGTVASMLGMAVSPEHPIVEGELPLDGSRFEGLVPPVVAQPVFSIRKRASLVYTLDDYVRDGILPPAWADAVRRAVSAHRNILISGSTGSGKTTLANAILHEIASRCPGERVVIIEDTVELQCPVENRVELRATDAVDMTRLLRATMRLRPDRIIVGEVRGAEALTLLKSWNTGHPGGVATVHANSAPAALIRLEQLIREAGVPPAPHLIAEAVDLVVQIARTRDGRRVTEVVEVMAHDREDGYRLRPAAGAESAAVPLGEGAPAGLIEDA